MAKTLDIELPRMVATEEVNGLHLTRGQWASFLSKSDAIAAAEAAAPGGPWASLFNGLEAAGLLSFLGRKT